MKETFEYSAWYRLINVVAFLAYFFVVLVMLLAGYIGYSDREITNATVNCADGTSWNALEPKNILYDSASLSGLCTNRNADGTYIPSSYLDVDYDAYSTEIERESLSWSMIIYPLIVFFVGFGLVDLAKLLFLYIFTGRIALEKSALLNVIAMLASDDKQKENTLKKDYALLLNIVDEKEIIDAASLLIKIEAGLKQTEQELNSFYEKTGHERTFFEGNKVLELDAETMEEFYGLDHNYKNLQLAYVRLNNYFNSLDEVNELLKKGKSETEAKTELEKIQNKHGEQTAEMEVNLALSKAVGEELVAMKKKYGNNINDKKVNMDSVIKKVYDKHPEWKKAKRSK